VSGTVDLAPDALMLRLSPDFPHRADGAWKLSRPVTVTKRDDAFIMTSFMKNATRIGGYTAVLRSVGNQTALTIDRLPLGLVTPFWRTTEVTGTCSLRTARVTGFGRRAQSLLRQRLTEATLAGKLRRGDCDWVIKTSARLCDGGAPDAAHALNARHCASTWLEQRLSADFAEVGCPIYKAPG